MQHAFNHIRPSVIPENPSKQRQTAARARGECTRPCPRPCMRAIITPYPPVRLVLRAPEARRRLSAAALRHSGWRARYRPRLHFLSPSGLCYALCYALVGSARAKLRIARARRPVRLVLRSPRGRSIRDCGLRREAVVGLVTSSFLYALRQPCVSRCLCALPPLFSLVPRALRRYRVRTFIRGRGRAYPLPPPRTDKRRAPTAVGAHCPRRSLRGLCAFG